jgi:hypothetical protein
MPVDLRDPSVGLDAATGSIVTAWEHVVQSLRDIFDTRGSVDHEAPAEAGHSAEAACRWRRIESSSSTA